MEPRHFRLASLFGSILRSFNIAPSNSRPFDERLLRRFEILEMWLNQLVGELRVDVEEMALMRGKRGVVSFGDDVLANAIWNGTLEVSLDHDWSDQDHGGQSLSIVHGVDADDLTSCIGVLAIDAVYAGWTDSLRPLTNPYFQEQLDDLRKALWNEELFPSQELIKMGG